MINGVIKNEVFECLDSSVKGKYVELCYCMVKEYNSEILEGQIYTDQYKEKILYCEEAQIILEAIVVLEKGLKKVSSGNIIVYVENKKLKNFF